MIKIATWNVNSINAHLDQVSSWVKEHAPDILLLQETKCEDAKFPFLFFEEYNIAHCGQKTYNGVAILSKYPIEDVKTSVESMPCGDQARFIEANITISGKVVKVISVYVPNGGEIDSDKFFIKLEFLKELNSYLQCLDSAMPIVVGGDFNVAPFDIDVYSSDKVRDHILFSDREQKSFRAILNSNFFDAYRLMNPKVHEFSWWDYRTKGFDRNAGMRIDFILLNSTSVDMLQQSFIDTEIRKHPKCSDHAPVVVELLL